MSKAKKIISKNIQKNKKEQKESNPIRNNILYAAKILYVVLIVSILVYSITIISKGQYKFISNNEETFNYTDILAGETFSRKYDTYYVVFFDESSNSSMATTISKITTNKIFTVDLSSGLNKTVLASESNNIANNADELRINGTTIIKIENGNNVSYIEGDTNVTNYLNKLK